MDFLLILGSGVLGSVAGWFVRKKKEPRYPIQPVTTSNGIVVPPNMAEGAYEVRLDGRVLYRGDDLDKAKKEYKSLNLPRGTVEFYTNGNHTVSRTV